MNPLTHEPDDQQRLDLLVDGELSAAERRQLLSSLDAQPGGWRRCALAFLEAQSWGEDLQAIARAEPSIPAPAASRPQRKSSSWWRSQTLGTLLALAASVVLCFGLGFRAGDWRHGDGGGGFHNLTRNSPGSANLASQIPAGRQSGFPGGRPLGGEANDQVTLVLDGAQAADATAVQVPVFAQRSAAGGLVGAAPAVPADVLRALERLGKVRQHQQYIPVRLNDGREAIVPMNRLELEPVNLRNFQ